MFSKILSVATSIICLLACGSALAQIQTPPDTPFGVGFTPRNFPASTIADIQPSMISANQVGSHMSFVWSWRRQGSKGTLQSMQALAKTFKLMTFVQIAPTALAEPSVPPGFASSFADAATREKFLEDVEFVANMKPDYINLCAELNLMYHFTNEEFVHFIPLYQEAYELAKQISPDSRVGMSMLHSLWVGFQQWSMPFELGGEDYMDFIGFTSYPGPRFYDGSFGVTDIDQFPPEWYAIIRDVYPTTPIVFSEIGWASTELANDNDQALFTAKLPELLEAVQPELISWAVLTDTEFFQSISLTPEQYDWLVSVGVDPDQLFNRFNGMGLQGLNGTPKPAWAIALSLDFGYGAPPRLILP